jgi:hypothetical protein
VAERSKSNSRKKQKTSGRSDSVYGTVNALDGILTVHYDPQRDEIEIEGAEPCTTRTETSYPRSSGKPKLLRTHRAVIGLIQAIVSKI